MSFVVKIYCVLEKKSTIHSSFFLGGGLGADVDVILPGKSQGAFFLFSKCDDR